MLFVTLSDLSLTSFQLWLIFSAIAWFTWIVTEVIYNSEVKEMKKEFDLWLETFDERTGINKIP